MRKELTPMGFRTISLVLSGVVFLTAISVIAQGPGYVTTGEVKVEDKKDGKTADKKETKNDEKKILHLNQAPCSRTPDFKSFIWPWKQSSSIQRTCPAGTDFAGKVYTEVQVQQLDNVPPSPTPATPTPTPVHAPSPSKTLRQL